jgi:hypothetical protein
MRELLSSHRVDDYRRNYRIEGAKFDPFGQDADGEPDYDYITEAW